MATFREEPCPLSLGEMRLFKQESLWIVNAKLIFLCKDVEFLPSGASVNMLIFLAFLG